MAKPKRCELCGVEDCCAHCGTDARFCRFAESRATLDTRSVGYVTVAAKVRDATRETAKAGKEP